MPLFIYSLWGEHTDTHIHKSWAKSISRNQACTGRRLVHTWFKKARSIRSNSYLAMYSFTAIHTTKNFDIKLRPRMASYNLLSTGCHESKYFIM